MHKAQAARIGPRNDIQNWRASRDREQTAGFGNGGEI